MDSCCLAACKRAERGPGRGGAARPRAALSPAGRVPLLPSWAFHCVCRHNCEPTGGPWPHLRVEGPAASRLSAAGATNKAFGGRPPAKRSSRGLQPLSSVLRCAKVAVNRARAPVGRAVARAPATSGCRAIAGQPARLSAQMPEGTGRRRAGASAAVRAPPAPGGAGERAGGRPRRHPPSPLHLCYRRLSNAPAAPRQDESALLICATPSRSAGQAVPHEVGASRRGGRAPGAAGGSGRGGAVRHLGELPHGGRLLHGLRSLGLHRVHPARHPRPGHRQPAELCETRRAGRGHRPVGGAGDPAWLAVCACPASGLLPSSSAPPSWLARLLASPPGPQCVSPDACLTYDTNCQGPCLASDPALCSPGGCKPGYTLVNSVVRRADRPCLAGVHGRRGSEHACAAGGEVSQLAPAAPRALLPQCIASGACNVANCAACIAQDPNTCDVCANGYGPFGGGSSVGAVLQGGAAPLCLRRQVPRLRSCCARAQGLATS